MYLNIGKPSKKDSFGEEVFLTKNNTNRTLHFNLKVENKGIISKYETLSFNIAEEGKKIFSDGAYKVDVKTGFECDKYIYKFDYFELTEGNKIIFKDHNFIFKISKQDGIVLFTGVIIHRNLLDIIRKIKAYISNDTIFIDYLYCNFPLKSQDGNDAQLRSIFSITYYFMENIIGYFSNNLRGVIKFTTPADLHKINEETTCDKFIHATSNNKHSMYFL